MIFVDVDSPDVMAEKCRIVSATPELAAPLTNLELCETSPVLLRSREYYQIACDLRQLHVLQSSLSEVASFADAEFLFLGELSLGHMDTSAADALIRKQYLCGTRHSSLSPLALTTRDTPRRFSD